MIEIKAPAVKSLRGQADAFFDHVLNDEGGELSALLTSTTVFYNKDLSGYYGVTGDDTFQALERTDGTASGILTLPALLAVLAAVPRLSSRFSPRLAIAARLVTLVLGLALIAQGAGLSLNPVSSAAAHHHHTMR